MNVITKSELIRASYLLPKYEGRPIHSEAVSREVLAHVAEYEGKDPAPWGYDDLPAIFSELYRSSDLDGILAGIRSRRLDNEIQCKTLIVEAVAKALPPSNWEFLDVSSPIVELEDGVQFSPHFDCTLRSGGEVHSVFVLPHADYILKKIQRDQLISVLSETAPGMQQSQFLECFEFPSINNRRRPEHYQVPFSYGDRENRSEVLSHFKRFHETSSRLKRQGKLF